MNPKLKICGITRLEDARYCAAAGADYLGFIQFEKSPRFIEPKSAKQIIEWVYGPEPVGVFVNATADVVNGIADEAGFALVQLHGDESPALCAEIERPVIKALRIQAGWSADELRRSLESFAGVVDYFLLDTFADSIWGGTGASFDWEIARELTSEFELFLAGGLGESNIEEAVAAVQPFAVDLSSSLESEPGIKDVDKLGRFFERFDALRVAG